MSIIRAFLIISVVCTALTGIATASQVSYAPLEDAIEEASWIMKATVLSANRRELPNGFLIEYELEPSIVLMGKATPPHIMVAQYREVMPVIRDKNGEVIGMVSLIYSGSGSEFSAKENEEWIFFFGVEGAPEGRITHVLRAEPLSKIDEIQGLIPQ